MKCTEFLPLKYSRTTQIPDSLPEAKRKQQSKQCRKYGIYPPINQSLTSNAVAAEILARAQNVAEECGKKTISVTYDLPIAKKAMQIRSSEKRRYSNVSWFIPIGLEFFKMFGKYID